MSKNLTKQNYSIRCKKYNFKIDFIIINLTKKTIYIEKKCQLFKPSYNLLNLFNIYYTDIICILFIKIH